MSWYDGARARARLLFSGRAAESRFDEEIRLHIDLETARLMHDGHLDAAEARRRALAALRIYGAVARARRTRHGGCGSVRSARSCAPSDADSTHGGIAIGLSGTR